MNIIINIIEGLAVIGIAGVCKKVHDSWREAGDRYYESMRSENELEGPRRR